MVKLTAIFFSILTFFSTLFGSTQTITVENKAKQEIQGFGTSAAWWAQMIEDEKDREYLAKELYSKDGLGLNIYRYNIGAGVNPDKNRVPLKSRQTESFLYFNKATNSYEYDFTRDANAQKMLDKCLEYGCIDTVILFANSPHYSMTINNEQIGSQEGGVSNIAPDKYQDFVDYFLTITEYFIGKGVPVKYISPINEPKWDWGSEVVKQEGCHYDKDQIVELMELFSNGIKERKLNVEIMAPESGAVEKDTKVAFDALKKSKAAYLIGAYAYHTYWSDNNIENKIDFGRYIAKNYSNEITDMSEWCELPCKHDVNDIEGAVIMARVMANDLLYLHANSWSSWVALNYSPLLEDGNTNCDAMFYTNDENYSTFSKAARYNAMAHFTKFVHSGSVVLNTKSNMYKKAKESGSYYYLTNSVAFKTPDGKIVVVIVNEDKGQDIKLSLPSSNNMNIYSTDKSHSFEKTYEGKTLSKIYVDSSSITTVIID